MDSLTWSRAMIVAALLASALLPATSEAGETSASFVAGSSVRLVMDDGSVVEGRIGEATARALLVHLTGGGFVVIDRARISEPPEARVQGEVPDVQLEAWKDVPPRVSHGLPAEEESSSVVRNGAWLDLGGGVGTVGKSGVGWTGGVSVHRGARFVTLALERQTETSNGHHYPGERFWSIGVLGGLARRAPDGLARISLGIALMSGVERGKVERTRNFGCGGGLVGGFGDCYTASYHERKEYLAPALVAAASAQLFDVGCLGPSVGLGAGFEGRVRAHGSEVLATLKLSFGAP